MPEQQISRVHVIFKTHLDVGFTDLAAVVTQRYLTEYFPRALALAAEMRQRADGLRFVWTTGSWLLYEYLERASATERRRIEAAIEHGDLAWHALPVTLHSELLDPALFRYGLSLAQTLDRRFGMTTIAGKMTDVPGHTRGIVPLLAEAGVRFLHIGVNPAASPPDVPPVFRWRDPSGAEVVVMYARGSYGDLATVPGCPVALAFAHTNDNIGPPPDTAAVVTALHAIATRMHNATVTASTLSDFARDLMPYTEHLPIITDEIGDTWIHGVGSDPRKVSHLRALQRLRTEWLAAGTLAPENTRTRRFSQALLLVAEHTWGLDEKTHLADEIHYAPAQLRAVRSTPRFTQFAASWAEQRAYLSEALAALDPEHAATATRHLALLDPEPLDLTQWQPVADVTAPLATAHFDVALDAANGAITRLTQRATGHDWADASHPLAALLYEGFAHADYERFAAQYLINREATAEWALLDYTKPGIERVVSAYGRWQPQVQSVWRRQEQTPDGADVAQEVLAVLAMPEASVARGAPQRLHLRLRFPEAEPTVQITVDWFEKPASRLPEALWCSFAPRLADPTAWQIEKLGEWISPLAVVRGGNRTLHAVGRGARYQDAHCQFALDTLDAPLIAPGAPALLRFDRTLPDLAGGMHVNLYNNVWGTNFPMWYDDDARFRFVLRCDA